MCFDTAQAVVLLLVIIVCDKAQALVLLLVSMSCDSDQAKGDDRDLGFTLSISWKQLSW